MRGGLCGAALGGGQRVLKPAQFLALFFYVDTDRGLNRAIIGLWTGVVADHFTVVDPSATVENRLWHGLSMDRVTARDIGFGLFDLVQNLRLF